MTRVREVCVIGLGLIGGSLLRAVTAAGRTAWGSAESAGDIEAATAEGFDIESSVDAALLRAARREALVVLAVPLTALDPVLAKVGEIAPTCLLTDVTSVKQPVVDRVEQHAPGARFVGGHPMAGTARSGWQAGNADLFRAAAWVACVEHDTELAAWSEVARLALDVGAHVVPATAALHDAAVARISHLPHLLAAVLASVGAEGGPLTLSLAAGSFTDGTRVAGTRPELTRAMTEGNRAALLPALDSALGMLGAARGALASTGSLAATINAGHRGAQELSAARAAERAGVRIDLNASDADDALLALGEQGGRITGLEGTIAFGEV
ncbi:MAG: prephenate dehydrogenase [Haloechinothrix sp.]